MRSLMYLFLLFLSTSSFSQSVFKEGYFTDNSGNTVSCFIQDMNWKSNPTKFNYRTQPEGVVKTALLEDVKQFSITGGVTFIRSEVEIDLSDDILSKLENSPEPEYEKQTLFLQLLIQGKASLYLYQNAGNYKYFFSTDQVPITQLVQKQYILNNKIAKNNAYIGQLSAALNCPEIPYTRIRETDYKRKSLMHLFKQYNICSNASYSIHEREATKGDFNITLRPRVNNTSLFIQNEESLKEGIQFDGGTSLGFGVEFAFLLPFNARKWAVFTEPTFQKYSAQSVIPVNYIAGGTMMSTVEYNSIEIPLGIRYHMYTGKNSKLFTSVAMLTDLHLDSYIEFRRADQSVFNTLSPKSGLNAAIGIGYQFGNRYSIEVRYHTSRNILNQYRYWNSDYQNINLALGYQLL